jgi:hypothetical protein
MKLPRRTYLLGLGAFLLPLLVLWLCGGLGAASAPAKLAVVLVGVERDPVSHPPKGRTVLNGGTGLCAIFAITNIGKDASIWFDTCAVEQKVGAEWRRFAVHPYASRVVEQIRAGGKPQFWIASDEVNNVYPPGTGWFYVVPWPPDVPTNTSWRLQLRYGRAPSPVARKLDDTLGLSFFAKRKKGQTITTAEVRQ